MLITGALLPSVYRVYVLWIRISLYQAQASQILHFGLVILTICRQIRSDYIHSDSIAKPQKAQSITSCAMHLSSCAAANAGMHARSRLLTIMNHHRSSLSSLSSSRSLALRPVLCALIRTYEAFGMLIYARHGEIYVNPRSLFPCLLSPLFHSVNTGISIPPDLFDINGFPCAAQAGQPCFVSRCNSSSPRILSKRQRNLTSFHFEIRQLRLSLSNRARFIKYVLYWCASIITRPPDYRD